LVLQFSIGFVAVGSGDFCVFNGFIGYDQFRVVIGRRFFGQRLVCDFGIGDREGIIVRQRCFFGQVYRLGIL